MGDEGVIARRLTQEEFGFIHAVMAVTLLGPKGHSVTRDVHDVAEDAA